MSLWYIPERPEELPIFLHCLVTFSDCAQRLIHSRRSTALSRQLSLINKYVHIKLDSGVSVGANHLINQHSLKALNSCELSFVLGFSCFDFIQDVHHASTVAFKYNTQNNISRSSPMVWRLTDLIPLLCFSYCYTCVVGLQPTAGRSAF